MDSLPTTNLQKIPNKGKSQRPLLELLHEQQEPFMLKDYLKERQYLHKRLHSDTVTSGNNKALARMNRAALNQEECLRSKTVENPCSCSKPCRLPDQHSKVTPSEPFCSAAMHSFSFKLPLRDSSLPVIRSHGRSHCKVSSPLRSPLKSPTKSSCIKSPSRGAARLMEAAVRILEPGLHTCSRPRPSFSFSPSSAHVTTTVRYLLELDHKANRIGKRRKRLKRNSRKTQSDLPRDSEEGNSCIKSQKHRNRQNKTIQPSHFNRGQFTKRACFEPEGSSGESEIVGEHTNSKGRANTRIDNSRIISPENSLNAWQRASEALISAFRLSPGKDSAASTQRKEGSLIQYSRIFSFKKDKRSNKVEECKNACQDQKNAKAYSLLKSIIRRLTPAKEPVSEASNKINCTSDTSETGLQTVNVRDIVSKRFSNAMKSFSRGNGKPELQENDQIRLRISDIVRWNSFDESESHENHLCHSDNTLLAEECISAECPSRSSADVMVEPCLSLEAEKSSRKMKFTGKKNKENWQAFLKRREEVSSDISSTSSSSAWFESCLGSDSGSTSLDVLSSSGSLEGSGCSDSCELKGIDGCVLEASSPCGYLSLDIDENGVVKDFHCSPNYEANKPSMRMQWCNIVCDQLEDFAASKDNLRQGYINMDCCSSPARSFNVLQISEDMDNPANSKGQRKTDRLISSCREIEEGENKNIPQMDDNISERSSDICNQRVNHEEVEQLSPVSVLDSPFEEETLGFKESFANIQRAKQQLLQKIHDYERLAHMDPLLLEKRIASWKEEPSEDECSIFSNEEPQMMDMSTHPSGISYQTSPCRSDDEEMEWEKGGTEEYVREVLNCSETISEDFLSSTSSCGDPEIDMQVCSGSSNPSSYFPSQSSRAKHLSRQSCRLLLDSVNEELQSAGKRYCSGLMVEPWLREQMGPEQLAKKICGQICAWKEVDANHTDKLVELDLKREGEEWKRFREEAEKIGAKIELAIFRVLVEEVLVDLVQA